MTYNNHAEFQVATKAIIRKGDEILVLMSADGTYDFPGGRMDEEEADAPLQNTLLREIEEECGSDLQVEIRNVAFAARRSYEFADVHHRILALYFEADYVSGEVTISDEHVSSTWVDPVALVAYPDKFVSPDEHSQFKNYFAR